MASIRKNYIYNIILNVVNILFPILSFPYVSRILGPEGVGKVQFVVILAQYFILFAALGIPIYGVREVAKIKNEKNKLNSLFSELIIINLFTSLILFVCYIAIILYFGRFQNDLNLFLWGSVLIILGFTSVEWFFLGLERFKYITIRSIVIKVFSLLFMFLTIKTKEDTFSYLFVSIFSYLAVNIFNIFALRKMVIFKFSNLNLRSHIKPLLIIWGMSISISIYTLLDTVLLGILTDDFSVGIYTAAIKMNKFALPISGALAPVLIPRISNSLAMKDYEVFNNLVLKSFNYVVLIAVPISVGLFLLAPEFIYLFSGSQFTESITAMRIMAPLIVLIGFSNIFGLQILTPANLEKYTLISVSIGMVISVILNVILAPVLKHNGTAIATITSELFVTIAMFYYVKRMMKIKFPLKTLLFAIACSGLFVFIIEFIRFFHLGIWLNVIVSILICAILYFILQYYIIKNKLLISELELLKKKFIKK